MSFFSKLKWSYLRYRVSLDNHSLKWYILPSFLFVLCSVVLIALYKVFHFSSLWTNWRVAERNAFTFCEHIRQGEAIVQPANTWSNFGFLFVGMLCLFIGINDFKIRKPDSSNLLIRYPGFSILLGASCIYLFFGSFMYHASMAYFFQKLDITGMYAVTLALISYNIFRFFPTRYAYRASTYRSSHHAIITISILLNFVFFAGLWKVNVNILFPSVILLLMGINVLYNLKNKQHFSRLYKHLFKLSIFVLVVSTVLWVCDREDIWCIPTSIFQGHALWHILNALSIFLLYMCYRTESINLNALYEGKSNVYLHYK